MRKYFQFTLPAVFSTALYGIVVFFFILPRMEDAIMSKKRDTTRELVQTLVDLLETYQKDIDANIIEAHEARKRALRRIQSLRYGINKRIYFWVTDTKGRFHMHPFRADLIHQDLDDIQERHIKKFIIDMSRMAEKREDGFIKYMWPAIDDPAQYLPKVAYIALFRPWGWIVGSGLYTDDVKKEISDITEDFTYGGLALLIVAAFFGGLMAWRGMAVMQENQQVMASLRNSEEKFRGISVSANDGIIMLDSQGAVTFWNAAAERIFGYREEEIIGSSLHQRLVPAKQYPDYLNAIEKFRATGTGPVIGKTIELHAVTKKGYEIPVELSTSAMNFEGEWHAIGVVRDISEKKNAEAALQESEAKYRTLFNSINDTILLMKADRIADCNDRATELFKLPKESLIGKTPMQLSPEHQSDGSLSRELGRHYIQLASSGIPQHFEWEHRLSHGDPLYVDVVLKKINLFGENLLFSVVRDITDRKKMAMEKERLASLLTASVEQSEAGIIIMDAVEGQLVQINKAALRMLGETKEFITRLKEVQTRRSFHLLDVDGNIIEPDDQPLQQAFKRGIVTYNQTFIIEKADKTQTWVTVNASPVKDEDGRILYGVAVFTDINDRIRSEMELQRLNKFQERIIENDNVWTTVHDADGNVHLWNKAAEKISGYERTKVIGKNDIWRWGYPDETERTRVLRIISEVIQSGGVVRGKETTIQCRDGSQKTILWYLSRLDYDEGKRSEVLCLGYDVTEIKQLHSQLLQNQKLEAVGTLAAGIAHDFNNVLWGILGFSELAMEQVAVEPDAAVQSIQRVLEAGNRAKFMVQQILQFSRQSEIAIGPLDLKTIVKEVTKLLRATMLSNYEIRLKMAERVSWVQADATQIHQVIMNLSTNAYHAMQSLDKGVLTLSLDMIETKTAIDCHSQQLPPGSYVRLQVSDTGEGIDPEKFAKIFDPYFTTKKQGEGTGLGLAVSFGIIKSHGGGIQVESRKGEGTTFSIYLPEKDVLNLEISKESDSVIGGSERILLVDDETILIEMTEKMLTEIGYETTCYNDSHAALDHFAGNPDQFDIVITDQAMPKMTGLEFSRQIKSIQPDIPVVICTGFSEHITPDDMQQCGISIILKKPLMRAELDAAIRNILNDMNQG